MTQPRRSPPWWTATASKVAIAYLLVAGLWIYTSDWLLAQLLSSVVDLSRWQTAKGGAFVIITAALLFTYLHHSLRHQEQAYTERNNFV